MYPENVAMISILLKDLSVEHEIIHHELPIISARDADLYFDASLSAPVLILKTDKGYFALIKSMQDKSFDFEKIKSIVFCEQVFLASKKEVYEVTGHKIGSIPLIGLNLEYILDSKLKKNYFVYGGTGNPNYTLKISVNHLISVNNVVKFA